MKNPIQIGDKVTINAEQFHGRFAAVYTDCTQNKPYVVTAVGNEAYEGEPLAVNFVDDVGDTIHSGSIHVTKV